MNDRPLVIGKGTKQRRDKYTWRYRHSLGKDPVTGKYRYSPWRTIHTTKSREVDAALEAYKAELNSGTYVQKSRDTVGSYAKKFHDNREGTITPLAYKREALDVRHIDELFGKIRLQELRAFMIEDIYADVRKAQRYSESEINKIHTKLKQVLDCAVRDEIIAKNPAKQISVSRPEPAEREFLSTEEAARLLDILLNREPDAHITCVMLMLDTGMRRAEALGMTWSDVSVENRSILIEQQFAADRSVRSPKSKKSVRRISISETLASYLEFWKKEQAREMESYGLEQVKGTPLVHSFGRTKDKHPQINFMDPNGFSRWFRNFSVENGFGKFEGVRTYHYVKETVDGETISKRYEHKEWLELRDYLREHPKVREARHVSTYKSEHLPYGYSGLSSHILRHTQATLLIGANTDIKTVQTRLGHASIDMTLNTYSHAIAANDLAASDTFNSLISNNNI